MTPRGVCPATRLVKNAFPVTATDTVEPSHPADEPTREWVNAHPENLVQRVERTRRYFRLCQQTQRTRFADGMDTLPQDMA